MPTRKRIAMTVSVPLDIATEYESTARMKGETKSQYSERYSASTGRKNLKENFSGFSNMEHNRREDIWHSLQIRMKIDF